MKRLTTFFLIACMLMLSQSCAENDYSVPLFEAADESSQQQNNNFEFIDTGRKITVGVSLLDKNNLFIAQLENAMLETAEQENIKLVIEDGKNNPEKQIKHVQDFIIQSVDVIILNASSYTECAPAVELAFQEGIPIITVNTKVENQDKCLSFIGSDAVQSGRIQMLSVAKEFQGQSNIIYLKGPLEHEATIGRQKGMEEVLDEYPELDILYEQSANWNFSEAYLITKNCLENFENIDAVVAQNDEMALGALKAIEEAAPDLKIKVFGIDAIPEALVAIKDGKLESTVFQNAEEQGRQSVLTAKNIALGAKVNKEILIPYELVNDVNVGEFYNEKAQY